MKRGTFAKRIGYALMKTCRVPFYNQKGNTVKSKKTGHIRTKYLSSLDEFRKYFNITIKPNAPHADDLLQALEAQSQVKNGIEPKNHLNSSYQGDLNRSSQSNQDNPF